ncbi:phosphatidate phosphatase APP1 [Echria macrotheca]|uniref:Phosphatidate phosphatase APP1 n=1 Tax=Echria macrotheca TaxID=438768 RepID=A0AAJ0FHM1_9PEZI|nr:phosphatidate phosphatase APP1 [Echria macrotheca]
MFPSLLLFLLSATTTWTPVSALPADNLPPRDPMITPPPTPTAVIIQQRAAVSEWDSYVGSIVSGLGTSVSSYIASGVPQFFQDLPTGTAVEKSLGISDSDLAAKPTQVLNLPAYGNWTDAGWNVFVHGNVYKVPDISEAKLDDLANIFLIDTDIHDLPPSSQAQARNMTASIFVVQQKDQNVTISFTNDVETGGQTGTVNAPGGAQEIRVQDPTTDQGDFAGWLKLADTTGQNGTPLIAGNETDKIQSLNMHAKGTDSGNATAYLVPPTGITIISDIDDILRVTKIWNPKEGLLNSFARPFTPWMNMPSHYAHWAQTVPNLHFHYLTTTPEQVTRNYMEFIFANYPLGSFDTRPLNFSDVSATLSIRKHLLDLVFETFPQRKFVLIGDTTNSDVMKAYPQLAKDHPGQVQCIWLRNTTATDATFRFPYDTKGFEGIDQSRYMFFVVPDDLTGLDVSKGECYNQTVRQNVTFGMQASLFGSSSGVAPLKERSSTWVALLVALGAAMVLS